MIGARRSGLILVVLAPLTASGQRSPIPVQLGARITPDTVTVGQRFIAVLRVRAPRGATIEFPQEIDSAGSAVPTAPQLIGKPVMDTVTDSASTTVSAAYRFAAWDIGPQPLGLSDVVVRVGSDTGYVSLAQRSVFVRSVLPADSALRVPKPARPAIQLMPFNWRPLLLAALAILVATALWRLYIWYRRRQSRPLDPFSAAEREFARIEAMQLVSAGKGEQHAALMSDVMRAYLAARVPEIEVSHTSSEMLARAGSIHDAARGLGELLWRTDLIKFANNMVDPSEAERLGASAREVVRKVEEFILERQKDPAVISEKAA